MNFAKTQVNLSLLISAVLLNGVYAQTKPPKARPLEEVQTTNEQPADPPPVAIPADAKSVPAARSVVPTPGRPDAGAEQTPNRPATPARTKGGAPAVASSPEEDLFNYCFLLYKKESNELGAAQFAKYLESYPKGKHVDAALTYKGECHLRMKQMDEAIQCYQRVCQTFKSGQFLAYSASRLGTIIFNDGRHAEAAPYFDIAATNAGKIDDRAQYRYYQGLALKNSNRMTEAIAAFEKTDKLANVTTSKAFQEKAALEIANHEFSKNKKSSAFARYEKLSNEALHPAVKAEAGVAAGLSLLDSGKYKESISFFESVLKIKDQTRWVSLAKYGLIRAAYNTESWKKVIDAWSNLELTQISQESRPQLILMVGNAQRYLENYAQAIEFYGMLDQFFPESKEASEGAYRRLVCLYKLKDPRTDSAAESLVEKLKKNDPESEFLDMARLMRAEDAFAKSKWEIAAKSYATIRIEKIPEDLRTSMLYRKGWAESQTGKHTQAIDSLTQYINQVPNSPLVPQALIRRAQSYLEIKDVVNAIKEFDAVATKYPDAREAEEAFRLGGLLRGQEKNYEGMIERLSAMLAKYPKTKYKGECQFWIGTGLFGLKKWRECIDPLRDAQKLSPEQFEDASLKIIVAHTYLEDTDGLQAEVDDYLKESRKASIDGRILEYLGGRRYAENSFKLAAKYLGIATSSGQSKELRPMTWFQLANSRYQVSDWQGVKAAVDSLLGLKAELTTETKSKSYYLRGMSLLKLNKLDEAHSDADSGLKLHTQDVNESRLYFLRGEVEWARGNVEEAASNYVLTTQLVLNDSVAVDAYRRLIQVFRKTKQADNEKKFFQEFRKKFPKEAADFEKEFASLGK